MVCYFTAGEVLVTSDLSSHTIPGYDLYIYVSDGNTLVGPRTLTVIIEGMCRAQSEKLDVNSQSDESQII